MEHSIFLGLIDGVLIALFCVPFVMGLISFLVNRHDYKNYKRTYDGLVSGEYMNYNPMFNKFNMVCYHNQPDELFGNDNDEIIFFLKEDESIRSIKLLGHASYIHLDLIVFDLYSIYWAHKLKNWFKKDIEKNANN